MAQQWLDQRGFLTNVYFSVSSKTNPPGIHNDELVSTFSKPVLYPRGQYEVALVNLKVSPKVQEDQPMEEKETEVVTPSEPVQEQTGPLFPNLTPPNVTDIVIKKENEQILKFMANMARKMLLHGYEIVYKIVTESAPQVKIHVVIEHKNENPGMFLRLPQDLALLMGFKRTDFYPGSSLPEEEMYDLLFQEVPVGKEYKIEFVTPTYTQNLMQVGVRRHMIYPEYMITRKTWNEFFPWLTAHLLEKAGLRVEFSFDEKNICTMEIHSMLDDNGDDFTLPLEILNALGFQESTFKVGKFTARRPINVKAFNNISLHEPLWFIARDIVPMQVLMDEPENLELDSVIKSVNNALLTVEYSEPITFYYYKGTLGFKIGNDDITIVLPDVVNSYFGFPAQQMFRSGVRVPLKKELIREEDKKQESMIDGINGKQPGPDVRSTQFLVLSSICANQYYENQQLPLLRQLDIPIANANMQNIKCDPLIYVPMQGHEFSVVRLKLRDEYLRPVQLQPDSITSAQLHVRIRL